MNPQVSMAKASKIKNIYFSFALQISQMYIHMYIQVLQFLYQLIHFVYYQYFRGNIYNT